MRTPDGQRRGGKRRRGSMLALVVIVLLVLSVSCLTAIQIGRDARLRTIHTEAEIAARYAADAGAAQTLYLMNRALANGTWNAGTLPAFTAEPLVGSNADYTANVTGSVVGGYQILSVGRAGNATRTVRVTLELTNPFALNFAVLTQNRITLMGSTIIEGYNSSDVSQTSLPADIGTLSDAAGTIDIKNDASISGNVYVGLVGDPDDVVILKSRSDVQGELFNQPPPLPELITVTAPTYTVNKGTLTAEAAVVSLTESASGLYSGIDIANDRVLRIEGHCVMVVTGDIRLRNSAQIQIAPTGSLTLYLQGNLIGDNSAGVNNETAIPSNFKLYGTGTNQSISLKNSMDFHGAIYAPSATMTLYNGGNVFGSVIVNGFEMKNSGAIYYDVALRDTVISDEAALFRIVRWEEL